MHSTIFKASSHFDQSQSAKRSFLGLISLGLNPVNACDVGGSVVLTGDAAELACVDVVLKFFVTSGDTFSYRSAGIILEEVESGLLFLGGRPSFGLDPGVVLSGSLTPLTSVQ